MKQSTEKLAIQKVAKKSFQKNKGKNVFTMIMAGILCALYHICLLLTGSLFKNRVMLYGTAKFNRNLLEDMQLYLLGSLLIFCGGFFILRSLISLSLISEKRFYSSLYTYGMTGKQIRSSICRQLSWIGAGGMVLGTLLGIPLAILIHPHTVLGRLSLATNPIFPLIGLGLTGLTIFAASIKAVKTVSTGRIDSLDEHDYQEEDYREPDSTKIPVVFQMGVISLSRNIRQTIILIAALVTGLVSLTAVYAIHASYDVEKYLEEFLYGDLMVASEWEEELETVMPAVENALYERIMEWDAVEDGGRLYMDLSRVSIGEKTYHKLTEFYESGETPILEEMSFNEKWVEEYQEMKTTQEYQGIVLGLEAFLEEGIASRNYILDGKFDEEKFHSGKYVIAEGIRMPEGMDQPIYGAGDLVWIDGMEFEILAVVEGRTALVDVKEVYEEGFSSTFYLPLDTYRELYQAADPVKCFFQVQPESLELIPEIISEIEAYNSIRAEYRQYRADLFRRQTGALTNFGVGISLVIVSVALVNFIIFLIKSMTGRKRELAMMQSIGMTAKQLKQLLLVEAMSHVGVVLGISYILGYLAVEMGIKMYLRDQWVNTYVFTLRPLLIATPVLLLIAALVPYFCSRKILKEDILEQIADRRLYA